MDLWEAPNYQWTKRKRFENVGIVELRFSVAKGKITEAQITGDFFGEEDIAGLEKQLIGLPYNEELRQHFQGVEVAKYIHQLTNEQFVSLLFIEFEGRGASGTKYDRSKRGFTSISGQCP